MGAALVLGGSASVTSASPGAIRSGGLDVSTFSLFGESITSLTLDADRPASVSVSIPKGFTVALGQAVGTEIGVASAALTDPAETSEPSFADAEVVVDDPTRYASDPAAQACAAGVHGAVWRITFSVLGQTLTLAIFVDADSPGGAYVARFCPQWQPSAAFPGGVGLRFFALSLSNIAGPATNGTYTVSARVVPSIGRSSIAAPDQEYELRSVVAIPHTLTLHATYQAKKKSVLLRGKLSLLGKPEARKRVSFGASTGPDGDFGVFGPVVTDVNGAFSVRRHVERTTQFTANVEQDPAHACTDASSAPGGCAERISRPQDASASVVLRKSTDPKLKLRKADQALARRANVKLADLPPGWQSFPPDPFSSLCSTHEPNLSKLTATGEGTSPQFFSVENAFCATSTSTVFAAEKEARSALRLVAPARLARCLVDEVAQDAEGSVVSNAPIGFPALGTGTHASRVVLSFEGQVEYIDFVAFRQKRLVVVMVFASLELPMPNEEVVAKAVAARARGG